MLGGGYNNMLLYRVADTGSAYVVEVAAGGSAAAANADAVISLVELEGVKFDYDASGGVKVTVDQHKAGTAMDAFTNAWAIPAAGNAGIAEVKFIDGSSSLAASGDDFLVAIIAGQKDSADSDKRLTRIVPCTVDPTSGSEEMKDKTSMKPALTLNSVKLKYALTIPVALFQDAAYGTIPSAPVLAVDTQFLRASYISA
jgi:hypothetical protein